jgi:ligand-binding sensor domain-containing protein/signal transduction histidine kinase
LPRIIYIFLLCLFAGAGFTAGRAGDFDAEQPETVSTMRTWRTAQGLPSDAVTAIIQTRDGFLWIGTTAGLVRFDGAKFTPLTSTDSPTNELTGITALCEDSNGRLWVGTQQKGLFELSEGRLLHYTRREGLSSDNVTSLAADNHGQVWIGGNSGLNRWDGRGFVAYGKRDGLPDESVSSVNVARSGTVWITTRVGLCRYVNGHINPYAFQTESQGRSPEYLGAYEDRRGNLWAFGDTYLINLAEGKRFNYFRSSEPASVRIWSLCEGRNGRLWIGTSGRGLFCFEDNRFQPIILGQNRWPYDVRAICEDREGNLWLGTSGGGLVQLRLQSVHVLRGGQGLPDSPPTALALDGQGRICVGLQRGGVWMGEAGRFDQLGGSDGLGLQYFISSVAIAPDGTVWAGTLGGGLLGLRGGREIHLTTADGLANNVILAMCFDTQSNLWISTGAGILHCLADGRIQRFDAAQGLPPAPVTAMIPRSAGGLWLGTRAGQVGRWQNGWFSRLGPAGQAENHSVIALCEDRQSRLWVGTFGGGLCCFSNQVPRNWGQSGGLPGETVVGIAKDETDNLWLATDTGIFRVSRSDVRRALSAPKNPLVCKLVSTAKTALDTATAVGSARVALSADGHLWFATTEGVLDINTRQSEIDPSVFPVYLESYAVNGDPPVSLLPGPLWSAAVTNENRVTFPVDLKSLEIHFTALGFSAPEEIQFRHKLEGSDADWVGDGGLRSWHYGNLPHGDYTFRVAARLADGPWLEASAPLTFTVPTPLYLQSWAIGLYVVFAVALVAGIVRLISHRRLRTKLARLEQQQSLERERMRIARDMHDEMGSKLTKISFLSEHLQMDMETGGIITDKVQSIAQASQDLLKTMDEIVWVVNPRNDTLENLTAYLSHYAVEYFQNTSIDCELRLPPEIPNYPLSSEARHNLFLTFEEALNNVLKHSGATKVKVEMAVRDAMFELKITDNGKGFDPSSAHHPSRGGLGGNGLKNMRQRLSAIGGECDIASRVGEGTVVAVRIHITEEILH